MARITPLHLIPALIAAASHAGEVTISQRPFVIEKSFIATALPAEGCVLLQVSPKSWSNFEIVSIAPHGSVVKKGDLLVKFDTEAIDEKLADSRREFASNTLALAQAEQDAKLLRETSVHKLEAIRRAAAIAKEENAHFTMVRRKSTEESAAQTLKRYEQMLSNQREELKQLTKMYEADDLTEDTEEIILIRQQDAVASAEFALRMEMLDHKRMLEMTLPREAKSLADSERDTAIALKKTEADIPRSIEQSALNLEAARTANEREKEQLSKLEADRARFEIKAAADGIFYHGPIENGRWTPGEFQKLLVPHGVLPLHKSFATFVPATAPFKLTAFLDDATARSLPVAGTGVATLAGREDVEIPVTLIQVATVPEADGTYRTDFSATWPKELRPAAGVTLQVRIISYQQASAITVPTRAITFSDIGWTVEVKLADGKSERRPVKRGRTFKEDTEIVAGLEAGQVIFVPEK